MSATTPTTSAGRPAFAIAATVALVLSALVDFTHIPGYLSGAPIPASVVALEVALGVAALVAAAGLWGRHRWAVPLALVVGVLTLLLGVMGLVSAGSTTGKVITALGAILSLAVIALVAPLATRRTVA